MFFAVAAIAVTVSAPDHGGTYADAYWLVSILAALWAATLAAALWTACRNASRQPDPRDRNHHGHLNPYPEATVELERLARLAAGIGSPAGIVGLVNWTHPLAVDAAEPIAARDAGEVIATTGIAARASGLWWVRCGVSRRVGPGTSRCRYDSGDSKRSEGAMDPQDRSLPRHGRRGRPATFVSTALLLMVLAACGGTSSTGVGVSTSSSTVVTRDSPSTWRPGTSGSMEVTATVSGRRIAGECSGLRSGKPTVLLEVGTGAPKDALSVVGEQLGKLTQVCSYDRAGKGRSDPPSMTPRPVAEVIGDAHAFLDQAAKQGATPPYFLVGQSLGGELVFLHAQAYPDLIAGFVSINPNPPYQTWLRRARTVETEAQIRDFELPYPSGDNEEGINTTSDESMLTDPLPAQLPYAVMFDEECAGLPPPLQNEPHCKRMLELLALTAQDLAHVGAHGSYLRVKGAGHNIHLTKPGAVLSTIENVWSAALNR